MIGTGIYNVLEKLCSGEPLDDKEQTFHEPGLVSVRKQLHVELAPPCSTPTAVCHQLPAVQKFGVIRLVLVSSTHLGAAITVCGRFTLRTSDAELSRLFHLVFPDDVRPRFNIAPTQSVLAVRQTSAKRETAWLHWGLIPSWAKDAKMAYSTINARCETVSTKPAFRHAFKKKRCLILADGFYEWEKVDARTKVPHWFTLLDGSPFAFAGLWERWTPPSGDVVESCTIVTTTANELVSPYHERMPVILHSEAYDPWLDPALDDADALMSLLTPYPAAQMKAETVSSVINNARNDVDPRLPRTGDCC